MDSDWYEERDDGTLQKIPYEQVAERYKKDINSKITQVNRQASGKSSLPIKLQLQPIKEKDQTNAEDQNAIEHKEEDSSEEVEYSEEEGDTPVIERKQKIEKTNFEIMILVTIILIIYLFCDDQIIQKTKFSENEFLQKIWMMPFSWRMMMNMGSEFLLGTLKLINYVGVIGCIASTYLTTDLILKSDKKKKESRGEVNENIKQIKQNWSKIITLACSFGSFIWVVTKYFIEIPQVGIGLLLLATSNYCYFSIIFFTKSNYQKEKQGEEDSSDLTQKLSIILSLIHILLIINDKVSCTYVLCLAVGLCLNDHYRDKSFKNCFYYLVTTIVLLVLFLFLSNVLELFSASSQKSLSLVNNSKEVCDYCLLNGFMGFIFSPSRGFLFYSPFFMIPVFFVCYKLFQILKHREKISKNEQILFLPFLVSILVYIFCKSLLQCNSEGNWWNGYSVGYLSFIFVIPSFIVLINLSFSYFLQSSLPPSSKKTIIYLFIGLIVISILIHGLLMFPSNFKHAIQWNIREKYEIYDLSLDSPSCNDPQPSVNLRLLSFDNSQYQLFESLSKFICAKKTAQDIHLPQFHSRFWSISDSPLFYLLSSSSAPFDSYSSIFHTEKQIQVKLDQILFEKYQDVLRSQERQLQLELEQLNNVISSMSAESREPFAFELNSEKQSDPLIILTLPGDQTNESSPSETPTPSTPIPTPTLTEPTKLNLNTQTNEKEKKEEAPSKTTAATNSVPSINNKPTVPTPIPTVTLADNVEKPKPLKEKSEQAQKENVEATLPTETVKEKKNTIPGAPKTVEKIVVDQVGRTSIYEIDNAHPPTPNPLPVHPEAKKDSTTTTNTPPTPTSAENPPLKSNNSPTVDASASTKQKGVAITNEVSKQLQEETLERRETIKVLYFGADGIYNLGDESYYINFIKLIQHEAKQRNQFIQIVSLRSFPNADASLTPCSTIKNHIMDFSSIDLIVLGAGNTIRDQYLCQLTLLNKPFNIPVVLWGSGFDDLRLLTTNRVVMNQLRNHDFSSISFPPTSKIVQYISSLKSLPYLFGGVRGIYTELFINKMLAHYNQSSAPQLEGAIKPATSNPFQTIGESGLLVKYFSADYVGIDSDDQDDNHIISRKQRKKDLAGRKQNSDSLPQRKSSYSLATLSNYNYYKKLITQDYLMVNFGAPTEGVFSMYGKNDQMVGAIFDLLIKEYSVKYQIILYATHTSDIDRIKSLYNLVISMGVSKNKLILVPTVLEEIELFHLLKTSKLSITFRYYATVLSAAANVPFIALAYRFKTIEFCDSINYSENVLTTENINYQSVKLLINRALFHSNPPIKDDYFQKIESNYKQLAASLLDFIEISKYSQKNYFKQHFPSVVEYPEKRILFIGNTNSFEDRFIYSLVEREFIYAFNHLSIYCYFQQLIPHYPSIKLFDFYFANFDLVVLSSIEFPHPLLDFLIHKFIDLDIPFILVDIRRSSILFTPPLSSSPSALPPFPFVYDNYLEITFPVLLAEYTIDTTNNSSRVSTSLPPAPGDSLISEILLNVKSHSLPMIGIYFSELQEQEIHHSSDSLRIIAKTIQLLSNKYSIILFTSDENHLEQTENLFTLSNTNSYDKYFTDTIPRIHFLPKILDVPYILQLLPHFKFILSFSEFSSSLCIHSSVPFLHISTSASNDFSFLLAQYQLSSLFAPLKTIRTSNYLFDLVNTIISKEPTIINDINFARTKIQSNYRSNVINFITDNYLD